VGERRGGAGLDRLTRAARAAADPLLAVLLAPACAACGSPLDRPTGPPVCTACWTAILPLAPPCCQRCGDPLPGVSAVAGHCPRCRSRRCPIDAARAVGDYDGVLRLLVHALKYDRRRSLARPIASLMRERGADLLATADAVVPVPLHGWRRLTRGFNQAADLARHLGPPVVPALRRVRHTRSQTDLAADARRRNVRGAFEATRAAARLAGARAVLVDDVATTGATLEACARALKRAGVREVRALTACRVVPRRR
jgi:ComF family protein